MPIAQRVLARFAKRAGDETNPLQAMTRQQATRYLYKLIGRIPDGLFRDQSWEPVTKIFKVLKDNNIDYVLTKTEYGTNDQGIPNSKRWKLEVTFFNKNDRPQTLYGTIVAAGAGSVADPLDTYDVSVVIG